MVISTTDYHGEGPVKEILLFNYKYPGQIVIKNRVFSFKVSNKELFTNALVGRWKVKPKKIEDAYF